MSGSKTLRETCGLLAERYGEPGRGAGERLSEWLSGRIPYAYPEVIERHLTESHIDLLFDAFWQIVPFGTGGRRGRVGYGANRMNPSTVAMTVQGHCLYLQEAFADRDEPTVVVANDVRVFNDLIGTYRFLGDNHPLLGVSSRSLGKLACEIYAGNGITVYFAEPHSDSAVLTTPELAYLIAKLGAVGGVNLSASHNPPDDNGIKVYDQYGSQPIAPADQRLVDAIDRATDILSMPFDDAVAEGRIRALAANLHEEYIDGYVRLYDEVHVALPDVPVTFTPLCGAGLTTVGDVLERLHFPLRVPPREGPDGTFDVIPFKAPNPEVLQATEPARSFADEIDSTIVLSSDPDADRVGLEVKLDDGSWFHFDGNQIGAILCYFLMLDPDGPERRGLVMETLVTTKILGKIVEEAGDSYLIDDLLVGFKYVADVLKRLGNGESYAGISCSPERLVLAVEESHGVIVDSSIRDKDATPACMYLAALHQRLHRQGRTLLDYYIEIIEKLGGYDNVNRSITMTGAGGMLRKDEIMASLRKSPLHSLGGRQVYKVADYWDEDTFGPFVSNTDRMPRNVMQFFADTCVVTVRPSGTEPKLKLYCQLLPDGSSSETRGTALLREVRSKADVVSRQVYNDLLARIDVSISEAALLLPDIIDLEHKREFDSRTVGALREALTGGTHASLAELLAWLGGEIAEMTPGTDALPAVKAAVAHLCREWEAEMPEAGPLAELAAWASE